MVLLLQIGAASVITNRGSFCYYKSGQLLLQIGAAFLLQIGAELLQIGAAITNRGNYYKSVHNTCQ